MGTPFIGEIRMFAGDYAPDGWHFCDGSQLAISDYETLFSLIGTTYGGDGQTNFAVPDLRGRVPVHMGQLAGGSNYVLGMLGGVEQVMLINAQIPPHNHAVQGTPANGTQRSPQGNVLASSTVSRPYAVETPDTPFAPGTIGISGRTEPHDNLQPYLCINFIISLSGIYPAQF